MKKNKLKILIIGAGNIAKQHLIVLDKLSTISRDDFIQKLKDWNIDSRPVFYPLSHLPMFETVHNSNAETLSQNGINLPSGHNLTEDDIEYICNVIKNILEQK